MRLKMSLLSTENTAGNSVGTGASSATENLSSISENKTENSVANVWGKRKIVFLESKKFMKEF